MSSIKPVDTVRTAADLVAADLEGLEGRWLDVPRLQQLNGQHQSGVWCGRTSAAMVYNYYCKAAEKADQYIGHEEGEVGPGQNGIAFNLRFLGGPHSGTIAGVSKTGQCYPAGTWETAGWGTDSGELKVSSDPSNTEIEEHFARHIDQIKKNNPVVQFTQLTKNKGHIVVISGYKKSSTRGELWLRIVDPCYPHKELIGASNLQIVTSPVSPDKEFSEYWIKARRLLEIYPGRQTRLYHHADNPGHFAYAIPDKPVKDDSPLVHKITHGAGDNANDAPDDAPKDDAKAGATTAKGDDKKTDEKKPEEKKAPPAKEVTKEQIEEDVIAGAYKEKGDYTAGTGFGDAALQKLLTGYCKDDGIDPAAMCPSGSSSGGGGDLEATTHDELPLWADKWRHTVSNKTSWGNGEKGRSKLAEAFFRKLFRDKAKAKGLAYPPQADEFFAHLFKSNANKMCKDMGGPGNGYCAAAASEGLKRALIARGYKMHPHDKWGQKGIGGKDALPDLKANQFGNTAPAPGDILSIVTAGTPRTGHVVTVLVPLTQDHVSGSAWVVSGNTGPGQGTVAVDIIKFGPKPAGFNPTDGKSWADSGDAKPPAGIAWVYSNQQGSLVLPDLLDPMTDAGRLNVWVDKTAATPGKTGGTAPAPNPKYPLVDKKDGEDPKDDGKPPDEKKEEKKEEKKDAKGDSKPDDKKDAKGGAKDDKKKPAEDKGTKPQPAATPPKTGSTRIPMMIANSPMVTSETVAALYHMTERGMGGFFPLGDSAMFHCGAHLVPPTGANLLAVADGEVVAARLGVPPGEHPWGDTGFVILRHPVKGDKNVYSMLLHLRREPLHPDRTSAPWLKRLLIAAMTGKDKEKKPKWRVLKDSPSWKDEDKGKFSMANVQNDAKVIAGVYEEEDELVIDHRRYVKLKGKWVLTGEEKVKELSPWSDFDINVAAKNNAVVKALVDGKVGVLDTDKDAEGKRQWKVEAGEVIGKAGWYLGGSTAHWSMFSKDAVFPSGALGEEEFKAEDPVKLKDLDLSSKDHGTVEHAKALIEAIDPKKEHLGAKKDDSVIEPGELRHFYRTPTQCWRGRYQAVKGLVDFKLDLDKLVKQDRYKSHTEGERSAFIKNGKAFLFWDELSTAEEFPTDGKAIFVHPVTGLRLMSEVAVKQDHDDPDDSDGKTSEDRLHAEEDVILILRDAKGPIAAANVTVKVDGKIVHQGKTDSQGELLLKIEEVADQEIEVSVDDAVVGEKGLVVQVVNETGAPSTLMPGKTEHQSTNGQDSVPEHKMNLRMRVKKGQTAKWSPAWDDHALEPKGEGGTLKAGEILTAERFVFRREDGKFEAVQTHVGSKLAYLWSIDNGTEKVEQLPEQHQDKGKEPHAIGSWSQPVAHLTDHPVVSGRVQNIADGTELEVSFYAVVAVGAPEHDIQLKTEKTKIAAGGFSVGLDPHVLAVDSNLLNTPRAVYAKLKAGKDEFSLRDQLVTVYGGEEKLPVQAPSIPAQETHSKVIVGFSQIGAQKLTLWDKSEAQTRTLSQLTGPVKALFKGEPTAVLYAGAAAAGMHLALEEEEKATPMEALAHQQANTLANIPNAPGWLFAPKTTAWSGSNGIALGICALHCKESVCNEGQASGCSEEIRQKNLSACHLAHYEPCRSAVQLGVNGNKSKAVSCGESLSACGSAEQDKSKCFFADPVRGANADVRERWHVSLPMQTSGDYPFWKPGHARNLRVALVNPKNGAAVICSQENRGPKALSGGHDDAADAAIDADAFKGKGLIAGPSMEAAWKLDLPNHGADAAVLIVFVSANTPLGPVLPGTVIELREKATAGQIMGQEPVKGS